MTAYSRGEAWEDKPEERNSCWYRPVETVGRQGHHH